LLLVRAGDGELAGDVPPPADGDGLRDDQAASGSVVGASALVAAALAVGADLEGRGGPDAAAAVVAEWHPPTATAAATATTAAAWSP
jgi:hypothetical protein